MKITKRQLRRVIREAFIWEADVPDDLLSKLIGSAEDLDTQDPAVNDLLSQTLEDNPDLISQSLEDNPDALQDMLGDSPEMMGSISDFFEENPEAVPEEVTAAGAGGAAGEKEKTAAIAADLEDAVSGMSEIKKGRHLMRITRRQLRTVIKEVLEEDKSGKGKCPDTGCIKKSGDKWRIISNKTGKMWPQHYDTKEKAENALKAYHVHN
tara:strand:+ start:177 stop:803 length:627 start_codon:yes stop_codon:yes gene_type:complete